MPHAIAICYVLLTIEADGLKLWKTSTLELLEFRRSGALQPQ